MYNNFQSRNNSFNRSSSRNGGQYSPPIDFSVNDIVFDKKTFEKETIDWSTNDINFADGNASSELNNSRGINTSIPPPAIPSRQHGTANRQRQASPGADTSITLQEVAKNLENLLYLRQTLEHPPMADVADTSSYVPAAEAQQQFSNSYVFEQPPNMEQSGMYMEAVDSSSYNSGYYLCDGSDAYAYEAPLYCETTYYEDGTYVQAQQYSPNNPLYCSGTDYNYADASSISLYSPNNASCSMLSADATCFSPAANNSGVAYNYTPGNNQKTRQITKQISRHNSVDSNYSVLSTASSPGGHSDCSTSWIHTPAGTSAKKPTTSVIRRPEDAFEADQELNSLVNLIISDE